MLDLSSHKSQGTVFEGGGQNFFNVSSGLQYFFADHFSAGLDVYLSAFNGEKAFISVAPVVTKYFLVGEKVAPYVSISPIHFNLRGRNTLASSIKVGTKFFLNDSVSFGPALDYYKAWGGGDRLSLQGLFSIHL